nr:hypothetical protein [Tanacetum cinerariifolium]
MVAYHTKSDASEGFNQIINLLHGSSIKYAFTMNPNIYVSCIKQFWTTVAVKKVVVTKATIRDALCLDDARGVECLPNEEIFAELARIGYEKPSTKLTFYKAFFSSQVGKGFSRVETPLFEGMLVAQEVEEGDADENVENVNAGDTAKGDVSAAHDEVLTVDKEPSIPSPTPSTTPLQPSQDIPSTSQAQPTPPQSPQVQPPSPQPQPPPTHDAGIPINLLQEEAKEVGADNAKDDQDINVQVNADIQGRKAESQAKIYKIDLDHANKLITEVVTAVSTTITAAEVPVPAAKTTVALTLTAAPRRRTKEVVIRDHEESSTTRSCEKEG